MTDCCLCGLPLYHPDDQTEQARMQHTVLLYTNRPLSSVHFGCAADYWHNQEMENATEMSPSDY